MPPKKKPRKKQQEGQVLPRTDAELINRERLELQARMQEERDPGSGTRSHARKRARKKKAIPTSRSDTELRKLAGLRAGASIADLRKQRQFILQGISERGRVSEFFQGITVDDEKFLQSIDAAIALKTRAGITGKGRP